jgi:hypothetical protein
VIPTAFVTDKRYSSPFELLLVFANFSCESLQFSSYHYLFPNSRGGENRRLLSTAPFRVVVLPNKSIVSQANTLAGLSRSHSLPTSGLEKAECFSS